MELHRFLGLLSLTIPALSSNDLKELELELLTKIVSLSEERQNADEEINKRSKEIEELKLIRKQIELLVRKASIRLYLQNKYEKNIKLLAEIYKENQNIIDKLHALGEEIKETGNQKLLEEVMDIIKERKGKEDSEDSIHELFWLKPTFLGVGINVNALFKASIQKIKIEIVYHSIVLLF